MSQDENFVSGQAYYALAVVSAAVILALSVVASAFIDWRLFSGEIIDLRVAVLTEILVFTVSMETFGAFRFGRLRQFWLCYYTLLSVIFGNLFLLILPSIGVAYYRHWQPIFILAAIQLSAMVFYTLLFHKLYYRLFPKKRALIIAETAEDCKFCSAKIRRYSLEFEITREAPLSEYAEHTDDYDDIQFVVAYHLPKEETLDIAFRFAGRGVEVCVVPEFYELYVQSSTVVQFGDMLAFRGSPPKLTLEQRIIKRTMDIILSALGLVVSLPFLCVFAAIIFARDRKNPLFLQERLTRGGKAFKIVKLRTMNPDAESGTGPVLAVTDDPRITPFGRFLRNSRFDELPQFWNVLKGDMSLIGPRPERPYFTELYEKTVPGFRMRLNVKAGITGMAHVKGRYDTHPEERLKLDLYYIMNYSFILDIKIIIETLLILFMPSYAQGVKGERAKGEPEK